ncbi:MAG: TonB-dependent receptor [Cyclobacteriaceae bacterium]
MRCSLLSVVLQCLFFTPLFAGKADTQDRTVSGRVASVEDESGIPGVNVIIKGTVNGTVTNETGEYSLQIPGDGAVLVFSYVGYITQEVEVGNRSAIDINLDPSVQQLGELVVVGYSTVEKVSLTSAVSAIQGEDLIRRTTNNIQQNLQGQLPGLMVVDRGAGPGRANMILRVRGTTTIGQNEPLVIVDGIEQNLADINPEDIESVTVLKDASSTAIYGSRAANGVILVTTKRPKAGKVSGSWHGYYGLQNSNNQPEHMEIEDFMRMQNIAWTNSSGTPNYSDQTIQEWVNATDRLKYPLPNTWYDAVLSTAPQVSNNVTIGGGTGDFKSRLTGRHLYQDGIIPNTESKLWEVRLNNSFNLSKKITLGLNLNYRQKDYMTPFNENSVWRNLLRAPFAVPRYPDGTYGVSSSGDSPLVYAELEGTTNFSNNLVVIDMSGSWEILKGLKFTTQYAIYKTQLNSKRYRKTFEIRDYFDPQIVRKRQTQRTLDESRNMDSEYTMNNLLNYNTVIGKHDLNLLLGYSQTKHLTDNLSAHRRNFYNNDIQSLSAGADDATKDNDGIESNWGLRSYFGRFNYSYQQKYLFEANGRIDGSSRFTEGNRYSFFPSFSAGWRISQEDFWSDLAPSVNELKFRGSWGKTGNQAVALYSYYPTYNNMVYAFDNNAVTAYGQNVMVNEDLTWETTRQIDIGMDIGLRDDRYYLNVDYYRKRTDGILLTLPIPGSIGLDPGPQNAGIVDNKGWEFVLGTRNTIGQVGINASINFNYNKNNVVDLAGTGPYINFTTSGGIEDRSITQLGLPLYTLWGFKSDGLFQTQEEVDNYPTRIPGIAPGDIKYLDLNEDGVINAGDMTNLGQSMPEIYFGGNFNFTYKGFALNLLFQGVSSVKTRIGGPLNQMGVWDGFAHKLYTNNYWTPENPGARFPRPLKYDTRNDEMVDMLLYDGTYLRLKNIQLLYQIPSRLTDRVKLKGINVYVAKTNVFTFSKLNQWDVDPETQLGTRTEAYPQTSLTTFGIQVDF